MALIDKFFKILRIRLKDSFEIDGLTFEILDESDWNLGEISHPKLKYEGPVPTYMITNKNNISWRVDNVKHFVGNKVEDIAMLTSNDLYEIVRTQKTKFVSFVDRFGNFADYEIPLKIKNRIKSSFLEIDDIFVDFIKTDYVTNFLPRSSQMKINFSHFKIAVSMDSIEIYIYCKDITIKKPDGSLVSILDVSYNGEELLDYLNWDWPEYAESLYWEIFSDSGLLSDKFFYDPEYDGVRFHLYVS